MPSFFSLNSCLILYQSKSSVRSNPHFFSLNSCLFSYQSKSSVRLKPHLFFFKLMLILISVQIFRSFKPPLFVNRVSDSLKSGESFFFLFFFCNLPFVQNPLFFFKFMLILISVQIFRSSNTPAFFSSNLYLLLYQSKSSVCSNPLFFSLN